MSTAIAPPAQKPRTATLGSVYKGAGDAHDGGWGKISQLVKDGRRTAREESLRWQENRCYYRGEQSVYLAPGESQLRGAMSGRLSNQPTFDNAFNRLRQFTDGRTALLTKERPPYEVAPENRDQDSIDAARFAEKFIAARWGNAGWNIKPRISELCQNGDIDGLAWLSVSWDPNAGSSTDELIGVDAEGNPIRDRSVFEALKAEDPTASSLWRMVRSDRPQGDVTWRVVLPAAISVDPFAVKDHRDAKWICESRVRPREEVEKRLGMSFKEAVRDSRMTMGERTTDVQYEDLSIEDGALGRTVNESTSVVVHYFYAKPCHDFPRGAHIEFCDKAPGRPLLVEEWNEGLPYFAFVPRPDPGHFIRSKGIVDDLKPIQRSYNSKLRDLDEWLKRVARTPVALPFGSMASDSYFNAEGVFFYHAAMGEPHHSNVPAEPTAIISNELARLVAEMRDISGVSASAQGLRAPGGPEAAVGINLEIQQTESNLSVMEANLTEAIEWGVSRSLQLVERHYSGIRTVTGVGVDDAEEFQAFQGQMLRGSHRFRITGPMMPKSKAARMASLQGFLPIMAQQGNVMPYIASLLDGDPTEMQSDLEADRKHQQGETRELLGLATNETALKVFKNFEEDKAAFTEAINAAVESGAPDPMAILAQAGIRPPNLTQSLQAAGFDMPLVEDFNNHALELKALDEFRKSDGYRKVSQMSKQLLREHADQHKQQMAQTLQAMALQQPVGQQQGSAPKEIGTASQPKNTPPQPGGMG